MGRNFVLLLGVLMLGAGCSPASSSAGTGIASTGVSNTSAPPAGPTAGPAPALQIPTGTDYTILGTVKANHRAGYDTVESLYPLLAAEAWKLEPTPPSVEGRRTVSAFS